MGQKPTTSETLNPYRQALRELRPAIVTTLGFSAVINALMLTGSIYMLQVYDRVLSSRSVPTLLGLFGIVVILFCFLALYDFLRTRMLSRAAMQLDKRLSVQTFRRWLRSGLPDSEDGAQAQPYRDIETIRTTLASPVLTSLFDIPFVPLFLAVLFIIHPWLGALTVAGAAVAAIIAVVNRALTHRAIARSAGLAVDEAHFADLSQRNAEAVMAMGMQSAITERWQALHGKTLSNLQAGGDPSEVLAASSRSFRMLLQSAMLTLGAFLVLREQITPGMIIASSILSGRALAPLDQLIGQWRNIGRASAAHRRLGAAFDLASAEPNRIELPAPTGTLTVTNLTKLGTAAPGTDQPRILSKVTFALKPGEGLGVIGNSASGKSTLARLLVGAGNTDQGEVRLDGATLDQWDPVRLGRSIGYLPQKLEMFPGTIRDNIARFGSDASDEDVIAAARLTGVHDIILALPAGYATVLGQANTPSPLSGGQIQRLGLARAIYRMPAFVVLDEPNSNLDVAGDEALTRTITALRDAGSAVVVMAHRPSALAALNKLLVLDSGVVQKFGDKEELLGGLPGRAPAPKPQPKEMIGAIKTAPKSKMKKPDNISRMHMGQPSVPNRPAKVNPAKTPLPTATHQTPPARKAAPQKAAAPTKAAPAPTPATKPAAPTSFTAHLREINKRTQGL